MIIDPISYQMPNKKDVKQNFPLKAIHELKYDSFFYLYGTSDKFESNIKK